jgi:hypothetical protein
MQRVLMNVGAVVLGLLASRALGPLQQGPLDPGLAVVLLGLAASGALAAAKR